MVTADLNLRRYVYLLGMIGFVWAGEGWVFAQSYSADWPQWRGPTRDGGVTGDPWPASLEGEHLKLLWRKELPPSFSGPIVVGDRVFVTETKDDQYEIVRALDRRTGNEIWHAQWEGAMEVIPIGKRMGSWIRGTPAYDGKRLFVPGMRDVLVCLDAETGEERWRADFHKRYGTPIPELGFVSSPLVVGDGVYVLTADSVVRVNKHSGASDWRTLVRDKLGHGAYSSADFGTLHGKPQVLVATIPRIAGIEPATGEVLWQKKLDSQVLGCVLSPIVYGDGIFTSTRASQTGFYPVSYAGGKFDISEGWKNKTVAYMSNPVIVHDHAYMHLQNRRMACIDLRTGETRWITTRRFGGYCSMIVRGDRILALSQEGTLYLIRATPEKFDLLDERKISEDETWAYLAMCGQELYVRERRAIAVYAWR